MESRLPLTQRLTGSVRRPKEIASWSKCPDGIHIDDRALHYYYFPLTHLDTEPKINLAKGFDAQKYNSEANLAVYLDDVLTIMMNHEKESGQKLATNVVTWRGLLTNLIKLSQFNADPGVLRDSFDLLVVGFDNQIFISQDDEKVKASNLIKPDPTSLRYMYTGFQFETVSTLKKPWGECTRDEIYERYRTGYSQETSESYNILIKSGIGSIDMVYGAESDCVENFKPTKDKQANYVELKTTRTVESKGHAIGFEKKLMRAWIQCFLSGVPKIIYGFRNDNLELEAVEEYHTKDIPKMIKNSLFTPPQRKWNGNDAIGFLTILMQWIKDKVEDGKTYRLVYKAHTHELVLKEAEISIEGRELAFLSNEFVNWRKNRPN